MATEKTISELLAIAGFSHARAVNAVNTYAHEIKDSYGNVIGHMTADRAVEFLAMGFLGYGAA